jgi:(p)ppGpp synthase/HD superfamily hydrolase
MKIKTLEDAIAFAAKAHKGATRRTGQPYILHPLRVMLRVETSDEQLAAILHDVVEDTKYTLDDLRKMGVSEEIVAAVDHLSRREGESYEDFVERTAENKLATTVKLADLQDNMDLSLLPEVTDKDLKRQEKYKNAYTRLTGEEWDGEDRLRLLFGARE